MSLTGSFQPAMLDCSVLMCVLSVVLGCVSIAWRYQHAYSTVVRVMVLRDRYDQMLKENENHDQDDHVQ